MLYEVITPVVLATAANGRYFGGGMHVAPRARPDDGLLDAVVIPGLPKRRLVSRMPLLYRGAHLDLPEVSFAQGRVIEIEPDAPWELDVDGEPFAARGARFEAVPGALRVLAPVITSYSIHYTKLYENRLRARGWGFIFRLSF